MARTFLKALHILSIIGTFLFAIAGVVSLIYAFDVGGSLLIPPVGVLVAVIFFVLSVASDSLDSHLERKLR